MQQLPSTSNGIGEAGFKGRKRSEATFSVPDYACAPLAGMQNGDANDFPLLVPNQNVVIRQLGIICVAWFLKVQVEHVGFCVVAGPDGLKWDAGQLGRKI